MRRINRMLPFLRNERGVALPLALMAFVVLAALSAALLAIGSSEVQIASNHLHGTQAFYVAEAGLEHAYSVLRITPTLVTTNPPNSLTTVPGIPADTPLGGFGNYTVQYRSAGANTVFVVSTGTSTTWSTQRVLRAIMSTSFISKYAILTEEVEVGGNGRVQGPLGAIHGNNKTKVEGSAFVDQTATSASNTCDGCTDASRVGVPGVSGPNKPAQTIPLANPLDFLPLADFIFGDGTTVVNGITVPVNKILQRDGMLFVENTPSFAGWSMQGPGEWSFSGGTTPPNGTFYASREIKITASPGSAGSPWRATFVAGAASGGGEVEIEGHPNIVPYLQDLLIIADKVEVKGTGGDASLTGAIVAKDEVEMEGSANLTGNVISNGKVEIKGNATITYSDGTVTTLIGPLQILSWGL